MLNIRIQISYESYFNDCNSPKIELITKNNIYDLWCLRNIPSNNSTDGECDTHPLEYFGKIASRVFFECDVGCSGGAGFEHYKIVMD